MSQRIPERTDCDMSTIVYPRISNWPDLPSSQAAEAAILGHILLDNAVYEKVKSILADDFSLDSNQKIYLQMCQMLDEGKPVDIVTLSNRLAGKATSITKGPDGQLEIYREIDDIGGVAYLCSLTEGLPRGNGAVPEYVAIVKEKAALRRIIAVCEDAMRRAREQGETASEIIKSMGEGLRGIGKRR